MTLDLLPVHRDNLEDDLRECLPLVAAGRLDHRALLRACALRRQFGILSLFLDDDPRALQHHLACAAQMYADGVRAAPPTEVVASRATPLFDAVAAAAPGPAAAVRAATGSSRVRAGKEYAHDFAFWRFVGTAALDDTAAGTAAARELHLAAVGVDDVLADLGAAFAAGNAQTLAAAVRTLADRHVRAAQAAFAAGGLGEVEFASEGCLWIRGMALAAVLARADHRLELPLPGLPVDVLPDQPIELPPGAWRSLD